MPAMGGIRECFRAALSILLMQEVRRHTLSSDISLSALVRIFAHADARTFAYTDAYLFFPNPLSSP